MVMIEEYMNRLAKKGKKMNCPFVSLGDSYSAGIETRCSFSPPKFKPDVILMCNKIRLLGALIRVIFMFVSGDSVH